MWKFQEGFSEEVALALELQESWAGGRAWEGTQVWKLLGPGPQAIPLSPQLSQPPAVLIPVLLPPVRHSALGRALPQQALAPRSGN